jgi:excinuclease ABC subunit C
MFKDKLKLVPHLPGSYQMYNKDGVIIYVGKAKDLHKRLSSYFNRIHTGKTAALVKEIVDFKYIITNSEDEAFIAEINLIKEYNPYYNILLKDDKSYPYIEYIAKPYPKLKVSRYLSIKKKDKKVLFGPYPNAYAARRIVNLLNRLYPLKKCDKMPKKPCLYYHIGECLGYCMKNIDQTKVSEMEKEILSFLKGNDAVLKNKIMEKISSYSESLNFEMANDLKQELDYLKILEEKQKIELSDLTNRDVISYYYNNGYLSIVFFYIRNGKLVGSFTDYMITLDDIEEQVELYIANFYRTREIPSEILIDKKLNSILLSAVLNAKFLSPIKGNKKKLLDMVNLNAKINLENHLKTIEKEYDKTEKVNEELAKILNLPLINRIDLFDNSNLFGSFSVSGMVVFRKGKPDKNEYRKYKISLDKNDDVNMMKEVIYRRYYKALVDETELPNLIIVDGGLNQINAAKSILEDLNLNIKVCGLVKNSSHRTNDLLDGDTYELIDIPKDSGVFFYLTRMQDEVHRFTINYHRQIRSKGTISSILDNIEGIGTERKKLLIKKYGSLSKIKEASIEELQSILPKSVAQELYKFINEFKK